MTGKYGSDLTGKDILKAVSPFAGSLPWRFSKYKVFKNSKDESFLVPENDAKIYHKEEDSRIYYPVILNEALELGRHIQENIDDNDFTDRLINVFCNKYGLFNISGLYLNDPRARRSKYDENNFFLTKRGYAAFGQYGNTMSYRECIENFFPDNWTGTLGLLKSIKEHDDSLDILYYLLMTNFYSEPIKYVKTEILDLYNKFNDFQNRWEKHQNDPSNHDYINSFTFLLTTNPVNISVKYNEGWKLEWKTNNLIDTLGVMILENITQEGQNKIKRCADKETCNRYFIATNPRQEYCSHSCNNAARQRRFQERKREAQ